MKLSQKAADRAASARCAPRFDGYRAIGEVLLAPQREGARLSGERSAAYRGQDAGRGTGSRVQPASVRPRQSRQRVRRLNAVANSVHSASTSPSPRNVNRQAPSWVLRIPNSGSINGARRRYACRASSVSSRGGGGRTAGLCGLICSWRPTRVLGVQTPKAGQPVQTDAEAGW